MIKHTNHLPHFFNLIGIFAVALIGFWAFSYDRNLQTAIAIGVSLAYFAWGMVHHSVHKDISFGIMLEYLAVSLLGLIVILSLIFRT